jgi:hypothetical protein
MITVCFTQSQQIEVKYDTNLFSKKNKLPIFALLYNRVG